MGNDDLGHNHNNISPQSLVHTHLPDSKELLYNCYNYQ
jgi:hypothetical protein